MLGAQPLTEPLAGVPFHRPVGFADRTQAEVVGPPNHHPVELAYHGLVIQQGLIPSGLRMLIASQTRTIRFFDGTVPR